ncbi:endonuclease V [Flavobacterium columnare]|uniref:endonuclease V n=2 Tax=Flavobacterium columnare TaxID=996 RepID=UPI0017809E2D|nr:endonuclease V [Flavobacterium columnare]QOG88936.1 endonuclease V [Flavobacterium columnare]QOG91595.1 endonuclease V [Flavobacterium columnare]QOG94258.1 endonuclease V [Flavobacterium columnare]QOG96917.1 endonuclease V [Flavobacterium columnare]QOG99575.1 endonuclease V [Flavobacterium columnare]
MEKIYPQNNFEKFIIEGDNEFFKNNNSLFTGIKETFVQGRSFYGRGKFYCDVRHGLFFCNSPNEEGYISRDVYIYIYGKIRFIYSFKILNSLTNSDIDFIYNLYEVSYDDSILIENFFWRNNEKKINARFDELFSREDLNYEKILNENQNILDEYFEVQYDLYSLNTFIDMSIDKVKYTKVMNAYLVSQDMQNYLGKVIPDTFMEKFVWQEEQIGKTINEDQLPTDIQFIGGVTVAYHDITQKIVAVVTVMDVNSQEIVDQAIYIEDKITMHIPDVFGFNETEWAIKAFEKLTIQPQLIFCDGHGIEHPKNMGLATFLGIQLDIPTIGCAKKRLVGYYKKEDLGDKRADRIELIFDQKVVGKALRTKENTNPIYVSIGHKISLETSVNWVLETTQSTRLPFVLEKAIEIARQQLPEQFRIDFMNDELNQYGIIK